MRTLIDTEGWIENIEEATKNFRLLELETIIAMINLYYAGYIPESYIIIK